MAVYNLASSEWAQADKTQGLCFNSKRNGGARALVSRQMSMFPLFCLYIAVEVSGSILLLPLEESIMIWRWCSEKRSKGSPGELRMGPGTPSGKIPDLGATYSFLYRYSGSYNRLRNLALATTPFL